MEFKNYDTLAASPIKGRAAVILATDVQAKDLGIPYTQNT
jgi:hypothetical protein